MSDRAVSGTTKAVILSKTKSSNNLVTLSKGTGTLDPMTQPSSLILLIFTHTPIPNSSEPINRHSLLRPPPSLQDPVPRHTAIHHRRSSNTFSSDGLGSRSTALLCPFGQMNHLGSLVTSSVDQRLFRYCHEPGCQAPVLDLGMGPAGPYQEKDMEEVIEEEVEARLQRRLAQVKATTDKAMSTDKAVGTDKAMSTDEPAPPPKKKTAAKKEEAQALNQDSEKTASAVMRQLVAEEVNRRMEEAAKKADKGNAKPAPDATPAKKDKAKPAPDATPAKKDKAKPAPDATPAKKDKAKPAPDATPAKKDKAKPAPDATPAKKDKAKAPDPTPAKSALKRKAEKGKTPAKGKKTGRKKDNKVVFQDYESSPLPDKRGKTKKGMAGATRAATSSASEASSSESESD